MARKYDLFLQYGTQRSVERPYGDAGEALLIMGNAKTGAIQRFRVLRNYHEQFEAKLAEGNAKLMVIGYSFQDEHINDVIVRASREHGLGTHLVDLRGREVLLDPKMVRFRSVRCHHRSWSF